MLIPKLPPALPATKETDPSVPPATG
jgi:hypothetical protein